jgi:opacity protein-like surface antigen
VQEIGRGWYLRGDVGVARYGSVKDAPHGVATPPLAVARLDDAWVASAGFGYRVNNWFRTDLTFDYRSGARFFGVNTESGFRDGYSLDQADVESITVLANAYVELGTWQGLTPYLGAGVGVASNHVRNYVGQQTVFGLPDQPPPDRLPDGDKVNPAYALMAGVSAEMGYGVSLDLGYRYMHLGQARTGLDEFGVGTRLKNIDAHEGRVGLRWSFPGSGFGPRPVLGYAAPLTTIH